MKLLKEVLSKIHRLDDEPDQLDQPETQDGEELPVDVDLDDTEADQDTANDSNDNNNEDDVDLELGEDPAPQEDAALDDPAFSVGSTSGGSGGGGGSSPADTTGETDADGVPDDNTELDSIADQASEDPDKAGAIRTVKKAHLVFKRQTEDGTFEELWTYNVGTLKDELAIRKSILAGTDIPVGKSSSPDGTQEYTVWSAGNAELLHITGLPN